MTGSIAELTFYPFDESRSKDVIAIFNRQMKTSPYVAEMTPELFKRLTEKSFFDPDALIIGYRGTHAVGFVHSTFGSPQKGETTLNFSKGSIRALVFPPDDIQLGTELLDRAVYYLKSKGAVEIQGWSSHTPGYPFYKGIYMGTEPVMSVDQTHVAVRFVQRGFTLFQHSIFLTRELEAFPAAIAANPPITFEHKPLEFQSDWQRDAWRGLDPQIINAIRDGEVIGAITWSLLPELVSKRGVLHGSIASLWNDEKVRRQGVGKALVAECIRTMYRTGAREVSVATTQENTAALHTYYANGFVDRELLHGYVLKEG